ncbi:MAG: hypothetical protein ACOC11_02255 [Prolixibacteraceae bacterium]
MKVSETEIKVEINSPKDSKEKLFDELVEVRLLYDKKVKEIKTCDASSQHYELLAAELTSLKEKIRKIKSSIARYGESFLDVYDSELMKPLSEADIIELREEIYEVRSWLESIKTY